ncbi:MULTISPECIES: capsular polysaccharide synthesis protein [unclassified Acinetobacter]|uniref:capsular polysaccharide synthesis protein n=1 Tax=unclassified Acinetobacter TaxID=196816 RepID=UPI001F4B11A6|nr:MULTISPECIES: capsular polysaccharide synthesis protein [unclassified Acinetobacter]MCH7350430.1 capsular polysaccharide synthesis protein [Acinetobacter sp. NIPH 2023]MCH7357930.1 capsular polysaccharide synthesis protein [Acinetobacter sp. NIPH 2024]
MNNLSNGFSSEAKLKTIIRHLNQYPLRLFYKNFVPKSIRKELDLKANFNQKQHVGLCWEAFLELYFSGVLDNFHLKAKKKIDNQKIIWQYWGQGTTEKLPNIVNICFSSVEKYKGDYEIIRLDDLTIKEYLDFPDFVWEKKKNKEFKHAFFSDLIRLALLDLYGGVWLDATILLTAPIKDEILESEYFMFQRDINAIDKDFWTGFNGDYFGWSNKHNVNVLNSFIVGKKNNEVIHICLDIMLNYWKTQNNIPHYFFFQIMFDVLIEKFGVGQCIVMDDTLPHLLQVKINENFNKDDYESIKSKVDIHKMTYFSDVENDTFYEYIQSLFR